MMRKAGRAVVNVIFDIRLIAAVLALSAAGTAVNFVLIGGALQQLNRQTKQGQQARVRQCDTTPIAVKVYTAEYRRGVITAADLALLRDGIPARCLK